MVYIERKTISLSGAFGDQKNVSSLPRLSSYILNGLAVTFDRREWNFGPFAIQIGSALRTAQYGLKPKDLFQADCFSRYFTCLLKVTVVTSLIFPYFLARAFARLVAVPRFSLARS